MGQGRRLPLLRGRPAQRLYARTDDPSSVASSTANGRSRKRTFVSVLPRRHEGIRRMPQLQDDGEGRMWLAFRHRTCRHPRMDGWAIQGRWDVYATACLGDRWLRRSNCRIPAGRNDMRVSSQRDPKGNVYFAYASDNRSWTPAQHDRAQSQHRRQPAVRRIAATGRRQVPRCADRRKPTFRPFIRTKPSRSPASAATRSSRPARPITSIAATCIAIPIFPATASATARIMDLHRYAPGRRALDFIIVTDHNMGGDNGISAGGGRRRPTTFTPFPARLFPCTATSGACRIRTAIATSSGRSAATARCRCRDRCPEGDGGGHRQTVRLPAADRRHLHAAHLGHRPGDRLGATRRSALEPFVEIFQGFHASSEAPGARGR